MRKPLFGLLTILSVLLSRGAAIGDAVELKRLEAGLEVGPRPSFTSPARELSLFQLNGSQTVEETPGFGVRDQPTPRKLPLGPFLTAVDACGPTGITDLKLPNQTEDANGQAKAVSSRIFDDLKQWASQFFATRNKFNVGGLKLQKLYMKSEIQEVTDVTLGKDQEQLKDGSTAGFETQFMFLYVTEEGQFTDPENEYFLRVEVFVKSGKEKITKTEGDKTEEQTVDIDTVTVLIRLAAKKKASKPDVQDGGGDLQPTEKIGSSDYVLVATVTLANNPPEADLAPKLWASAGVAFKLVVAASVRSFKPSFLFPEWCGFQSVVNGAQDISAPLDKASLKYMEGVAFKAPAPFKDLKWSPIAVGWGAEPFALAASNSFASAALALDTLKNVDEAVKGQLGTLFARGQAFRRAWPSAPAVQQIAVDREVKPLPFSNTGLAELLKLDVCPFLPEKRELCEFFFSIKGISDLKITPEAATDDKPLLFRLGWSQSLEVNLVKDESLKLVCVETEMTLQAQLANDLECAPDAGSEKETDGRVANGAQFELPLRIVARKLLLLQFEAFSRLSQFDILSFALASLAFKDLSSVTSPAKKSGGDGTTEVQNVDTNSQLSPAAVLSGAFANPLAKIDELEKFSLKVVQTEATVDFELALDAEKFRMMRGTLDSVLPDYSKLTLNSGQQTLELLIPLYPSLPKVDLESLVNTLTTLKTADAAAEEASANKRAYFATEYAANIIEFGATLRAKITDPESKPSTEFDKEIFGSQAISFSIIVGLFQEVMLDDLKCVQVFQSGMLPTDTRLGCLGVNYAAKVDPLVEFTGASKVKAVLAKPLNDGGANGSDPMKPEFWSFELPAEEKDKKNSPFFEIPSLTDTTLVLSVANSKFKDGNLLLHKVNEMQGCGSSANAVSLEFYMLKEKKRVDAKLHFYDGDMFKSVQVSFESVYFSHSFVLPIWELHELKDMFKTVADRMVKHYNKIASAVVDPEVGASYGSFIQVFDTLVDIFKGDKLCLVDNGMSKEDLNTIKAGSFDLYWTVPARKEEAQNRRLGVSRRADGQADKKTKRVLSPGFFFERRLSKSVEPGTRRTPLGRKSRLLRTNGPVPRRLHKIEECGNEEMKKANLFLVCDPANPNPWTLSFAGEVPFGSAKKPVPINSSINFAPDYAYDYTQIISTFKENILNPDNK